MDVSRHLVAGREFEPEDEWFGFVRVAIKDHDVARQAEVEKEYLATVRDEVSRGAVWAGESVDLVNDVPSAAEIIDRIVELPDFRA